MRWAREVRVFDAETGKPAPMAKAVLYCLADHANTEGVAFVSQETIAAETQWEVRSVGRAMRLLEAAGLIDRTRRHRKNGAQAANETALLIDGPPAAQPTGPTVRLDCPSPTGLTVRLDGASLQDSQSKPTGLSVGGSNSNELLEANPKPEAGRGDGSGIEAESQPPSPQKPERPEAPSFESVWSRYPKSGREGRQAAMKAYHKLTIADRCAVARSIPGYEAKLKEEAARGFNRRAKNLSGYINGRMFDDFAPDEKAAASPARETLVRHFANGTIQDWRDEKWGPPPTPAELASARRASAGAAP